jgi:hypothetical protein
MMTRLSINLSFVLVAVLLVLVIGSSVGFEDEDEDEEDEAFHLSTARTCSTISSGVRLRFQPSRPLAQNLQP